METTRIKIKIGEHEFDAEGPVETVQAQFEAFREIVSEVASHKLAAATRNNVDTKENTVNPDALPHISIEKILHLSGRVVSLTALPKSASDAALLIMLGQKDFRDNVSVTGQEIGDGLAQSGREVPRVDRIMEQALKDSYVLKTGIKRGTRYRLTNLGLTKALTIAKDLIESLP